MSTNNSCSFQRIYLIKDIAQALSCSGSYARLLLDSNKLKGFRSKGNVRLALESDVMAFKALMLKERELAQKKL